MTPASRRCGSMVPNEATAVCTKGAGVALGAARPPQAVRATNAAVAKHRRRPLLRSIAVWIVPKGGHGNPGVNLRMVSEGQNPRVLVIDDERALRDLLSYGLVHAG